ncbi:hypothetical protein ACIQMZ_37205 [Streptomyces longwoodensis]|uniref:hypothetical protein n=1 Tax=Streptomyces longwoodensis TaxID=68231 RepID=UPI00382B4B24
MTGHHPVTAQPNDTTPETDTVPMFPALSRMERRPELQPRVFGREPYWRAPVTTASRDAYVPAWNWTSPTAPDVPPAQRLTLDANGAYLGALGGIDVAHSHLTRRGPVDYPIGPKEVLPGYYLIDVPYWPFSGTIVHPLGDSARLETESRVWIAHPTLILLLELQDQGVISVEILDSWNAQARTNLRKWQAHLKQVRAELLDAIEQAQTDAARAFHRARYDAFKEGYSAALSMMLTGEKCKTHRPDWTHAVHAQHAATMWRKGWRWTGAGYPIVSMGHTDELTVLAEDLAPAMSRPKPPFRYDPTGHALGAMKPKPTATEDAPTTAPAAVLDTEGDVL